MIPNLKLVAPVTFGRDNPNTTIQFQDIGHFALPKRMLKESPSRCGHRTLGDKLFKLTK